MANELTKKEETSLADQELIKEAQSLTGESDGMFIPFIPILKVDNTKELKSVTVDGKMKEIKVLPDAGFSLTKKNEDTGKYEKTRFSDSLEAVILRVRYKIQEKYDKANPTKKLYYSYDFDMIDPGIKVFEGNREIAEGTYAQLKERFNTGVNDAGFPTKSFDLVMVLYVDLDEEVYRFERKVTMNDAWYVYRNEFLRNDTFVGYKTKFILKKETAGDNDYWALSFEKGDKVDLSKEIAMQKEISKFFKMSNITRETTKNDVPVIQVEDYFTPGEAKSATVVEDKNEINIEDVPF